jgi:antitoxin component of MazEF toxin-antitoxin module
MPLIRNLVKFNTSRAVCLPVSLLEFIEREKGCDVIEVAVKVDKVLTISPIIPKKDAASD